MAPIVGPRPPLPSRRKAAAPPGTIAHERRVASQIRPVAPVLTWIWIGGIAVLVIAALATAWALWSSRVRLAEPRHRAEAVCFALAQSPVFDPPMSVECNAAMIRGHFPSHTTIAIALQSVMNFTDEMVVQQSHQSVGDFDVTSMWLRLPESGGSSHWLVLGWIEGSDLAVCSFRFGGRGPVIGEEERFWGQWLMQRVLQAENFQAAGPPKVRVRLAEHQRLPRFGPAGGS